jgi:hypothetical protein
MPRRGWPACNEEDTVMPVPTAAELTASLEALDAAIVAMAEAYHTYLEASDTVLHATPALNAQLTHAHTIGASRLPWLVAARLRALGLDPVLVAARRPGTVGPEWVETLSAKLEGHVPAPAPLA